MRIKFVNLHMLPWCLQMMGNHISCVHMRPAQPPAATVKLIKSDGLVNTYDRPIHVSELLDEYPKHLVCRSDSFFIGQKIPALSVDDQLVPGHKYFLLPKHCFQSALSFVTIASFVSTSKLPQMPTQSLLKKAATCQAFDIQKTPSGCLRIRVSEDFISELMEESKSVEESWSRVCTTPELQKHYGVLVRSRQWKPKLETIREKNKRKLSSFGMKKSQSKVISSEHHLNTKSCSKVTQKPTTIKSLSDPKHCSKPHSKLAQISKSASEHHLYPKPTSKSKSKIKIKLRKQ
ncbi:uncharacterized protein LOC126671471 [Mercurialis annua]|uniref:uncharacterized protein LOC126671471 n=1 Tax=Mercurialis annua TaxID=3986 RepID=UPI00215DF74F|nr:uncharacterized protein LOC126671471 [Mercurialis annua]